MSFLILSKVRDLLLHKLPFSGELPDYDELTSKRNNELQLVFILLSFS